jgi:hypothetical protein
MATLIKFPAELITCIAKRPAIYSLLNQTNFIASGAFYIIARINAPGIIVRPRITLPAKILAEFTADAQLANEAVAFPFAITPNQFNPSLY